MLNKLQKRHLYRPSFHKHLYPPKPTGDIVHIYQILTSNFQTKISGKSTLVKCCFHEEDTPSLALYPSTSSYFCFGCQKHGDIFSLVEGVLGCNFKDALRFVKENQ